MPNYVYGIERDDGVFVAIGSGLKGFLAEKGGQGSSLPAVRIRKLPDRESLDKVLESMRAEGVEGFFNVLARSQHSEDNPYFAQAKVLNEGGIGVQVGWYGFFRTIPPGLLSSLPSMIRDYLK